MCRVVRREEDSKWARLWLGFKSVRRLVLDLTSSKGLMRGRKSWLKLSTFWRIPKGILTSEPKFRRGLCWLDRRGLERHSWLRLLRGKQKCLSCRYQHLNLLKCTWVSEHQEWGTCLSRPRKMHPVSYLLTSLMQLVDKELRALVWATTKENRPSISS